MTAKWINATQFERDHSGLRNVCAIDGRDATEGDPLVLDTDGWRIHLSHTEDPNSGCYGTAQR